MNKKKEIIDIEILKQLKQKYLDNKVSVLVGAGFTKNVYPLSPSWWMLVHDMVSESFKREIERKISEYKHISNPPFFLNDDQIREKCIEDIIEREGYLNVASDYESFKGNRESLDVYIEHYNPYFHEITNHISEVECLGKVSQINEIDFEAHHRLLNCNWIHVFTTNFDNSLEVTNEHYQMGYDVVTNGYEISTKGKKAIIKIHGNLVREDDSLTEPFQFDDDKTRRYIITQEDFDTYQTKHPGFSYLLRVALLQGAYCLVGFSGDDPNYLGWLGWVKDILDKEPDYSVGKNGTITTKNYNDYKVFMIKIDNKPISQDVKLFNRNHHIGVINLGNLDVLNFLQNNSPKLPPTSDLSKVSEQFKLLFSYLEPSYNRMVINSDPSVYYKALSNLENSIDSGAGFTENAKKYISLVQDHPYLTNIFYELRLLSKLKTNIEKKGSTSIKNELLLALVKITGIGIYNIDKTMSDILYNIDGITTYCNREKSLLGNTSEIENDSYDTIMRKMFHMELNEAKALIKEWRPKGYEIVRKTFLSAILFNKDLIELGEYLEVEIKPQKKYLATYVFNTINGAFPAKYSTDEFRRKNIAGFREIQNSILDEIRDDKLKSINSYGNNSLRHTLKDISLDPYLESSRFLHYMVDMGIPTSYFITNLISIDRWYDIFTNIYRSYLIPCFYYSCFYNDAEVLTRIGEDYIYTEKKEVVKDLLDIAFRGLSQKDSNGQFVFGLLQISKEFFCYVPEEYWFDNFLSYFDKIFMHESGKVVYSSDANKFVSTAISHIHKNEHINKVFKRLSEYLNINKNVAIDLIGRINYKGKNSLDKSFLIILRDLKVKVDIWDYVRIYLFIPSKLRSKKMLSWLADKFSENKEVKLTSNNYWLLYYLIVLLPSDDDVKEYIKKVINENDLYSIDSKPYSNGADNPFIPLYAISDYIKFDNKELDHINDCIKKNIIEIENYKYLNDRVGKRIFIPMLQDMSSFCMKFFPQEIDLLDEVNRKLNYTREFFNYEDALYSDDEKVLLTALNDLCAEIRHKDYTNIATSLNIVIERALQCKIEGLTYILYFIAYAIKEVDNSYLHDNVKESKLFRLLDTFQGEDLRKYNLYFISAIQSFIAIAKYLQNNGQENEIIDYWLSDDIVNKYDFLI